VTATRGRCPFTWNPGEWPYLTRCSLQPHSGVHVDGRGRKHEEEPGFGPAEAVVTILTSPDYRSPTLHRDKLRTLAMEWPALAAALGALVKESGLEVPSPLRRAADVIAKETGDE
jgi:hypothetical protein